MSRTIFYDIENFEPWRHQEKIFKHTSLRTFLDLVSGTGMTGIAVRRPGNDDADDDADDDEDNDVGDDEDNDVDDDADGKNHLEHNNLFRFICEKPGATIEA